MSAQYSYYKYTNLHPMASPLLKIFLQLCILIP